MARFLPKGKESNLILRMMEKSVEILKNHSVNLKRIEEVQSLLIPYGSGERGKNLPFHPFIRNTDLTAQ